MPKTKLHSFVPEKLVDIRAASKYLGRVYSRSAILRRINSGEWVEGVHWLDDRMKGAQRRIIKINLDAVDHLRLKAAGER